MAFSQETTSAAWRRAGGQCECTRKTCSHHAGRRCQNPLEAHKWHAHHKTAVASGGDDTLANCEALCIPCHENTRTYGR